MTQRPAAPRAKKAAAKKAAAKPPRVRWKPVVERANEIVRSYITTLVTLRQLFYRLVSDQVLPNTKYHYQALSHHTAQARRDGWFPDLLDRNRDIEVAFAYDSPSEALDMLARGYRLDRTAGQPVTLMLGIEKSGLEAQLSDWFSGLGIPIVPLGGFSSQTLCGQVSRYVEDQERPAVLIYAGDFDASGQDILRDFVKRTDCWERVVKVALTYEQITEYDLPELPGKEEDSRAEAFMEDNGLTENIQVEIDALDPDVLRALFQEAIGEYRDEDAYRTAIAEEKSHRDRLREMAREFEPDDRDDDDEAEEVDDPDLSGTEPSVGPYSLPRPTPEEVERHAQVVRNLERWSAQHPGVDPFTWADEHPDETPPWGN